MPVLTGLSPLNKSQDYPIVHLFHQQEIVQLQPAAHGNSGLQVYLWVHDWDTAQLIRWAEEVEPSLTVQKDSSLHSKRYREKLSTQILLYRLCSPHAILEHKPNGAPYLLNTGLHISISHTRHAYALSLSQDTKHGIDVEKWGSKALSVSAMFLHELEHAIFQALASWGSPEEIATLVWSAKESVYKLCEISGLSFLHDIRLRFHHAGILIAEIPRFSLQSQIFYRKFADFVLTCAVNITDRPDLMD